MKGMPVAPLTGVLDLRSNPDLMPPGAVRMRQNLQTKGVSKLVRGCGWAKLLDGSGYNNQDLHDQLLTFSPGATRKPVTLLFPAEMPQGPRFLFAGTQSQIAILNEYSGDWRVLGSGFGGKDNPGPSAPRFKAAQVDAFVCFTNDFDPPQYHVLDSGVDQPLNPFPDLYLIGVTRAAVCWSFHGCLFLADVVMDGQRFPNMILWSDYQNPTSFDPAKLNSITGQEFLNPGEQILAALPFGNTMVIYTNENIWSMTIVGGDQSFDFGVIYSGHDNRSVGLLKYPNTLVSVGDEHAYLAEDALYTFSPYYIKPTRPEWAHYSTPALYDTLDKSNCQVPVAHHHDCELFMSVPRVGAPGGMPDITLRFQLDWKVADIIDHGFSAFANYQSFSSPTIRDFAIQYGICTEAGLAALGYPMGQEGLPKPPVSPLVDSAPTCFYTTHTQTIDGVVVEDWTQPSADPNSLCAAMGDLSLDDFCRRCGADTIMVAASSQDWCLKDLGKVFYREQCLNPTGAGTTSSDGYSSSIGNYVLNGYDSILRFAPAFLAGVPGDPPLVSEALKLDYEAVVASQPASVSLRIGVSAQPTDPNGPNLLWFQHSSKLLEYQTDKTAAQHLAAGTIPAKIARWTYYREGRMLCPELRISGTGGQATLTRVTMDAKPKESHNA